MATPSTKGAKIIPLSSTGAGGAEPDRRLAAIVSIDVVDYSHLMEEDEAGTHEALTACCRDFLEPLVASHHGRIVKLTGDGALIEFGSAVDAVKCAFAFQNSSDDWNRTASGDRRIIFRIGVNIGDIIVDHQDIYGTGVIVATRLQAIADPGAVFVSAAVVEHVATRVDFGFEFVGKRSLKHISEPVDVYRVVPQSNTKTVLHRRLGMRNWKIRAAALVLILLPIALLAIWLLRPWHDAQQSAPLSSNPSIAVLPFRNLSTDPAQDYFADGITEDLITDLAKFPDLTVIARTSSFAYKDRAVTIATIRKELGVRYVLEGSVQKSDKTVRITAQLIDTTTGDHVWAERYDRNIDRIFEIQDDVTTTIAGTLMGTTGMLAEAELKRVSEKPKQNFVAYDYLMQGWHEWYKFTPDGNKEARRLFEEARKVDPNYARAYVALAWTYALDYEYDWTDQYDAAVAQALELAKTAVQLDNRDYRSYWILGWAYLYDRQHDQAEAAYAKARQMNPNDAELMAEMASLLIYIGKPQQAVAQLKEAMRRNPFFDEWYVEYLGWAYQEAGMPKECIETLEKIIKPQPTEDQLWLLRLIAACYADPLVNRMEDAHNTVKKILALDPTFSMEAHRAYVKEALPYKSEQSIDKWIEALSRTGLPN
jgi:adenylate cyclase